MTYTQESAGVEAPRERHRPGFWHRLSAPLSLCIGVLTIWAISLPAKLPPGIAPLEAQAPDQLNPARIVRVEMLPDPDNRLDIGAVVSAATKQQFQPVDHVQSLGLGSGTVWLRVTIWGGSQAMGPHLLLLRSPLLQAQLYSPSPAGYEVEATLDFHSPPSVRPLPDRFPIFEVHPTPARSEVYLVRMRSPTYLLLDARLLTPAEFLNWARFDYLVVGLYVALHFLLMLSSIWFARNIGDGSYAWLAVLTGANLLFYLGLESLLFQQLLWAHPQWILPLISALWVIRVPLSGAFVLTYLGHTQNRLARSYLTVLFGVAFIDLMLNVQATQLLWTRWYQAWALIQACIWLALAAREARRGRRGAGLLLLAFAPPLAGGLSRLGMQYAGFPVTVWTHYGLLLGFALFLIVMHYAAIWRYRDMHRLQTLAQAEAYRISRDAESKLEARVTARTHELADALDIARTALAAEEIACEEQRQFFLTMQHELRTPLAVIDAANRNLQRDLSPDSEAARLRCSRIARAVEQLNSLLVNSLRTERLRHDQPHMQQMSVELRPLIFEACDAAQLLSAGHIFALELDGMPERWVCDPALTVLALRTLTINAVKYSPAGTRVTIRGLSDQDGLRLEVRDDGPGVHADDLSHLFERFFRARNAVGIPGTGLGLPLARKMIELQDGRLTVDSVEHQGFTAVIRLPRLLCPQRQAPSSSV